VADLIALSAVVSASTCSKPPFQPSLRGGRIDALEAGPTGVPQPETDIQSTLQSFAGAGFNKTDTIVGLCVLTCYGQPHDLQAITACSHTMGSVHHSENEDIGKELSNSRIL
jgi:Peroxidase